MHSRRPKNTSPFSWVSPCVHRGGWTRNLLTNRNPYAGGSFCCFTEFGENSVPLVPFRWWHLPRPRAFDRMLCLPTCSFKLVCRPLALPALGVPPKCNREAQANHPTEFIQRLPRKEHSAPELERLVGSLIVFILSSFLCNGRAKAKAGFLSVKPAIV